MAAVPAALFTPVDSTSFLHVNPPYRAEHVGSLLRPPQLLEKRALFDAGKCSKEELKAAEDEAIAGVLKLQQDVGLRSWTDGEMRRYLAASLIITHVMADDD